MLSIGLIGIHQERYYTELSREDYYTEGGEPPGQWFGSGATHLDLIGEVDKVQLAALFRGFAPGGDERMVRNAGSEQRLAAFDLTFNAPKSVSVLFSQSGSEHRQLIQDAQAEAVKAALGFMEQAAGQIRLGKNGAESLPAGLTVATFEHSTARLVPGESIPDCHLHTHAVCINTGITTSGSSATLDSREILRHKMTAGVLYRAELFRQIESKLGMTAVRGDKFCELRGVPKSLIVEFSKRRRVIEDELAMCGITSYGRATDDAALKTRTTKPKVDRAKFLEEWKRIGNEHGFAADDDFFRVAMASSPTRDTSALVAEAVQRAAAKVTAGQAHFAEREFIRALGDELEDKGVGAKEILEGARCFMRTRDVVPVGEVKGEGRFTTREMLELEQTMLAEVGELARRPHRVQKRWVDAVLQQEKFETIRGEQKAALVHVTQGRAVSIVRGIAGSGKTYMLEAARKAWEAEGLSVIGATLSSNAAKTLATESGIHSSSIAKLLYDIDHGKRELTSSTVLVIDEAAMVGTRQMARLVSLARGTNSKLVLVGDDRQLQAIEAGAPFASMRKRFGAAEMRDIQRQNEKWARDAVLHFSQGDAKAALKSFADRGLIHVLPTKVEAIRLLTDDYLASARETGFAETLVLTSTRAEARRINREVQLRRRLADELGATRVALEGEVFHVGDRVLFKSNSKKLGVLNGDRGDVVNVTEHGMTVRLGDGARVTIHEDAAALVSPQLGYASTTHSSQGATVDKVLVLAGGSMQDREATYVQASRARIDTHIYTDSSSAGGPEHEALARAMERSRAKDLASDVLEDRQTRELIAT